MCWWMLISLAKLMAWLEYALGSDAGLTTCPGRMLITIQSSDGDSDLDPPWSVEAHRCHTGL